MQRRQGGQAEARTRFRSWGSIPRLRLEGEGFPPKAPSSPCPPGLFAPRLNIRRLSNSISSSARRRAGRAWPRGWRAGNPPGLRICSSPHPKPTQEGGGNTLTLRNVQLRGSSAPGASPLTSPCREGEAARETRGRQEKNTRGRNNQAAARDSPKPGVTTSLLTSKSCKQRAGRRGAGSSRYGDTQRGESRRHRLFPTRRKQGARKVGEGAGAGKSGMVDAR